MPPGGRCTTTPPSTSQPSLASRPRNATMTFGRDFHRSWVRHALLMMRVMALKLNAILGRGKVIALSSATLILLGLYFSFFSPTLRNRLAPSPRCSPKRNIVFLKTHKCGSSTVQNILFRYGDNNNLNFVLPLSGIYLGREVPFSRDIVKGTPWHSLGYNIFAQHTVFNETEIRAIMPSDAVFISILRNPVGVFDSLYHYARFDLHYHSDLESFIRSDNKPLGRNRNERVFGFLGRNQMLHDLGFNGTNFDDMSTVRQGIRNLERIFDFMLIVEHFDESLVLLKHLLCWETEDIIYFRKNARSANHKHQLSSTAKQLILEYNAADKVLYDHFLKQFQKRVDAFGKDRMKQEIRELRILNKKWFDFCVEKTLAGDNDTDWIGDKLVVGFKIRPEVDNVTCHRLAKSEVHYTKALQSKQLFRAVIDAHIKYTNYSKITNN